MKRLASAIEARPRVMERHWWIYIILPAAAIIWFLDGPYQRFLDSNDPNPWLIAEVEVDMVPEGKPRIWYRTEVTRDIDGEWTAYPETREGVRWPGGNGSGHYSTQRVLVRPWDWVAFFGQDVPVPSTEFRVCVFYNLTSDAGVERRTPRFCSDWVTP